MTTTVVKVINPAGGGDYTTWQSWIDHCPPDLTTVDQVWQGQQTASIDTGGINITGITADATRYVEMTAQAGASFRDNANVQTTALNFSAANGASISVSTAYAWVVKNSVDYTRINKLQIRTSTASGRGIEMNVTPVATLHCTIDDCIISGYSSGTTGSIAPLHMYGSNQVVRNTLVIQNGAAQASIAKLGNGAQAYNCAFVCPSDVTAATVGITGQYAAAVLKNCMIGGATAVSGGTAPTFTTCATDVASPPTGCTAVTYANCFVNTTSAGQDFRLKSGSPLIDAGTTDATNGATDIVGTARPQGAAYDIGAWEYVSTSTPVNVSISGQRITLARGTVGTVGGYQTVSVSGQRITTTQGVVTIAGGTSDVTVSITGIAATITQGPLAGTVHLVAPTGIATTTAQGVIGVATDVTASGRALTTAQGQVAALSPPDVSVSIMGQSVQAQAGMLTPLLSVSVTSLVVQLASGAITISGGIPTSDIWKHVPPGHGVWKKL